MNVSRLDQFLVDVIAEACIALQIRGVNNEVLTTDFRVKTSARMAYSAITGFVKRDFVLDTYREYYVDEDTRIRLRNHPISELYSVSFVDNPFGGALTNNQEVPLTNVTDYQLSITRKDIFISNTALSLGIGDPYRVHVLVEYKGGYGTANQISEIYNALLMQTIANYNRLPVMGLGMMQGADVGQGSAGKIINATNPDYGGLIDSVKLMISPHVYFGSALSA